MSKLTVALPTNDTTAVKTADTEVGVKVMLGGSIVTPGTLTNGVMVMLSGGGTKAVNPKVCDSKPTGTETVVGDKESESEKTINKN